MRKRVEFWRASVLRMELVFMMGWFFRFIVIV